MIGSEWNLSIEFSLIFFGKSYLFASYMEYIMKNRFKTLFKIVLVFTIICSCSEGNKKKDIKKIWLIGDSTMANYALEEDYLSKRFPVTGWGQVFQQFFVQDSLPLVANIIPADSIIIKNRARGGRSTRTFFQEGRWRFVYENIQPGDLVLIQFGHNDAAENKPERYVNIQGYKEFLRLFVSQSRQKKGIPVLLTPVARNYPWIDGRLVNVHGDYPEAVKEVANEMNVKFIDLNQLSMEHFSRVGREYVTEHYFMNLPAGKYEAYPNGQKDNTHFQPEGAMAVAQLVFNGLKKLQ